MTGLLEGSNEVWVHVDTVVYGEKPNQEETKNIQNRILNKVELKKIEDFAKDCGMGKAFKTGVLPNGSNCKESLISIQILALDFDNMDSDKKKLIEGYATKEEMMNDEFIMKYGAFVYDSFNSEKEHERFRVIFILDHALTDHEEFAELYEKMRNRFPYSDAQTSSASNLFYGGRNVEEINFSNLLPIFDIIDDASFIENEKLDSYINSERQSKECSNWSIWKLLKNGRKETAIGKAEKLDMVFETYAEAEEYFLKSDLRKFLGFPNRNPFRSPFREDENPSVSYFKSNVNDNWLYKDFGEESREIFDNITLLQEVILPKKSGNYTFRPHSRREVLNLLLELTSCNVKETDEQKKIIDKVIEIEELLKSPSLEVKNPSVYKVIVKKNYDDLILLILDIFKDSFYEEDSKIYHLSWYSSHGLSKKFAEEGMKISKDRIKNALKLMSALEILENLPDADIPDKLLKKFEETKESYTDKNEIRYRRLKAQDRRSNAYKINSKITIDELEETCKVLLENKYSIRNLNKEWFLRYFGEEKANRVFPQSIDVNRGISKRSKEFEQAFTNVFFQILEVRGYVVIGKVKNVLMRNFDFESNEFDNNWSRLKKEFCDNYDLELEKIREDDRIIAGVTKRYCKRNSSIVYGKK